MKKALLIISAVGGYCLLELGFLLGMLGAIFWRSNLLGAHEAIPFWGQLLIIPGLAALLSRITYGSENWLRRALLFIVLGAAFAPALITLIIVVAVPLAWAFSLSKALFTVMLPILLAGCALSVVWVVRKGVRRGIRLEAQKWRADRELRVTTAERKWRGRALRIAVTIPAVLVLAAGVVLPEMWGVVSHLTRPRAGRLAGYSIPVPLTWVILQDSVESAAGGSSVGGLAGRGMAMGVMPYLRGDLTVAGWTVGTEPYGQPGVAADQRSRFIFRSDKDEIVARRDFLMGKDRLTCEEYQPAYVKRAHWACDSSLLFIRCDGPGRLYATLVGKRRLAPDFYRMIEGIKDAN